MNLQLKTLSSLAKVLPDESPKSPEYCNATMLKGEVFSFQAAYYLEAEGAVSVQIRLETDLSGVSVRMVGLVPAQMPAPGIALSQAPTEYLRGAPGLFPDPLYPIPEGKVWMVPYQHRTLWITVDGRTELPVGEHVITLRFIREADGEETGAVSFFLTVLDQQLAEQKTLYTEWFHCDCLSTWYQVPMMSEAHWALIEKYAATAAKNGINMLLTPVFTPALDTAVGKERPTMQLVRVEETAEGYQFDFSLLGRWISMCHRVGIQYFEISHLFTQWGAAHAPKIMGYRNGSYVQLFGWETDSLSSEYTEFLHSFLPQLTGYLKEQGIYEQCYFHLSDEPNKDNKDRYAACRQMIAPYLPEERMMDALSDYAFYEEGLVKLPIVADNHIDPFLDNHVNPLWTYYCCGQVLHVSNKFIGQPSVTNRILGTQMFKYDVQGFLQWGYNFWYSALSDHPINPFTTTDGDCVWPAGDPFCVYPGKDGPIESLRLLVFHEGLQDQRALQQLAERKGKAAVIALMEEGIEPITFSQFPREETYLLKLREKVNKALCER